VTRVYYEEEGLKALLHVSIGRRFKLILEWIETRMLSLRMMMNPAICMFAAKLVHTEEAAFPAPCTLVAPQV
jgi:hypothetical protein